MKKQIKPVFGLLLSATFCLAGMLAPVAIQAADDAGHNVNYSRAAHPVVAPEFIPLPLGQVTPTGWLRDWAVSMRNGITGHLDERNPVFRDGWKGIPIQWTGAEPDGTGWPIEQSSYWMDGAIRLGYLLHDDLLIKKIRARLDPIVEGVMRGNTNVTFVYWKQNFKPEGFDSWAHHHMGRALFALYSGSREKRILDAMTKVYSDYPSSSLDDRFGICNVDPMMEVYALTACKPILASAEQAFQRPSFESHVERYLAGRGEADHMVTMYENIRVAATLYPWTGKRDLLEASKNTFKWLEANHQLPYGLTSGEEFAAGIGAGRKTETCDIPAMFVSATAIYRIDGDGAWGDRMEKVFFNAAPATMSRDCETVAYYQTPNRIRLDEFPVESRNPGAGGIAYGPLACSHVLCCAGAVNRILPYYIGNMWMATEDNGLAATLYGPCNVDALVGQRTPVKMECATDYPFRDQIRMTVTPKRAVEFPLYLRVPAWCTNATVRVNEHDTKTAAAPGKNGFLCINRKWSPGDVVELKLPMRVSVELLAEGPYPAPTNTATPDYFKDIASSMFEPRTLPCATVNYGPLLFALAIPDVDPNTPVADAKCQYALDMKDEHTYQLHADERSMPKHWDWPLAAPLSIKIPAKVFDWKPTLTQALPAAPVDGENKTPIMLSLIPYGCAKFQISMFPVTTKTWGAGVKAQSHE